jgi:4-amino-4-deoxy-L-arabinose transferase-like glycosyltransferase
VRGNNIKVLLSDSMQKKFLLLIGIVLIALLLRFIFLGSIAPSLTWDETSWGYNAYSIGLDGRDEFGKLLPLTYLESFGDFKPPVYAYLDIFPIKIFGLNEFATRFPSAFFGTLTVLLTYFLVKEIFGKEKEDLALISSFMLAISPWHIMLSRAAFEANVANFFIVFGVFLFLKALRTKPIFLPLSVLSFVLAMNTFNSARIVVPILGLILVGAFYKKLLKPFTISIISFILGVMLLLPLLLFMNSPQAKLRFNEVNIFTDIGVIDRTNQEIKNDNNSLISKILHNRRFTYGVEYIHHYLDNLAPQFLFIQGDGNPKFSIQDVGQLYIWEIPFFVGGLLLLFRKREKYWWIIPVWLVVGIIPAGFARETPHALRIESALPTFQIITAIGIYYFLKYLNTLKNKNWGKGMAVIFFIVVLFNLVYFAQNYFYHYSYEYSGEWQYGYKESIAYVSSVQNKYDNIYITESLGRPYIYYLFYLQYPPQKFRNEGTIYREALGFVHVQSFSKFHFSDQIGKIHDTKALYIATPGERPGNTNLIKEFKLLNGHVALVAYTL